MGKRYHTILKNSSFRGHGVFSPSCIRERNLRDNFHSVLCSYQKGFAEASFHLIDFANRSSIFGKRRDHVTQFSNIEVNAPLQKLLLLVNQEPAIRILKERIFTNRLTFSPEVRRWYAYTRECSPRHEKERFLPMEAGILRLLRRTCVVHAAKTARITL